MYLKLFVFFAKWHINLLGLFNIKAILTYSWEDKVWFGLVWLYGISTMVGYLMLNPLYMNIKYMIPEIIL